MSYRTGQFIDDAPLHRGWFVGTFIEDGASKTDAVEIKYTELPVGPTDHGMKVSATFECSIFIEGKTKAQIGSDIIVLSAGDYVSIEPGTPNNLVMEVLELVKIFTSDPSAKKVIN